MWKNYFIERIRLQVEHPVTEEITDWTLSNGKFALRKVKVFLFNKWTLRKPRH